jgi:hypothetical protein
MLGVSVAGSVGSEDINEILSGVRVAPTRVMSALLSCVCGSGDRNAQAPRSNRRTLICQNPVRSRRDYLA